MTPENPVRGGSKVNTETSLSTHPSGEIRTLDEQDRALAQLILELGAHARPGIAIAIVVLLGTLAYALLAPHVYTASVKLLPQDNLNQSGIFSQLQVLTGAPVSSNGTNEALYGKILTSGTVLNEALKSRWKNQSGDGDASLYQLLGLNEPDNILDITGQKAFMARARLREKVIGFTRDPLTGYMVISVSLVDEPGAAADLANFLADRINRYNKETSTAKALAHRDFIQSQLVHAEQKLGESDRALTAFLKANRQYQSSPELRQVYNELKRNEEAETQIWIELRRQSAIADVDANRQNISLTILDRATPPVERSRPNRRLIMVFGLMAALAIGTAVIIAKYQWSVLRKVRNTEMRTAK